MKKLREVRVRYTHPAIPPIGIKTNKVYKVGDLLDIYKSNDLIKEMFTPIDTTWDTLSNKNIKKNKIKGIAVDLDTPDERAE